MTQKETTELEHELAAALRKIDDECGLLQLCKQENEEKRKDIVYLATEKARLELRIDRLEEAGDALYEAWHGYGFTKDNHLAAWRQAKEAKP